MYWGCGLSHFLQQCDKVIMAINSPPKKQKKSLCWESLPRAARSEWPWGECEVLLQVWIGANRKTVSKSAETNPWKKNLLRAVRLRHRHSLNSAPSDFCKVLLSVWSLLFCPVFPRHLLPTAVRQGTGTGWMLNLTLWSQCHGSRFCEKLAAFHSFSCDCMWEVHSSASLPPC